MYKKLFSQTIIYGMSNVLVRVFPFVISPMLFKVFGPVKYSTYADYYAAAGIISVLLTHGMETTFFRFFQKYDDDKNRQNTVYSTAMFSVIFACFLFLSVGLIFRKSLSVAFKHPDEVNFLVWFLFILASDALSAVPFAKLRIQNKATYFAVVKILNSVLMFILTIVLVFWIPSKIHAGGSLGNSLSKIYNLNYGIGYAFAANLIASVFSLAALIPIILKAKFSLDIPLWKNMLKYAWPVTIAGLAGIVNETMDRQFLKYILPDDIAKWQIGVYSAVYKIATFIALFKTAYLLGVEPFFFSHAKEKNSTKTYAKLMKYYTIFSAIILLFLVANLDWIGRIYINNPEYWEGLRVVPLILIGSTFLGIYLNLSIWYKLTDKTTYGAIISVVGALITIILNIIGIPFWGYWACAWATLLSYFIMMIISYIWGQKIYPIPYNNRKIIFYLGSSSFFSILSYYLFHDIFARIIIGNILFMVLLYFIYILEQKEIESIKLEFSKLKTKLKNKFRQKK